MDHFQRHERLDDRKVVERIALAARLVLGGDPNLGGLWRDHCSARVEQDDLTRAHGRDPREVDALDQVALDEDHVLEQLALIAAVAPLRKARGRRELVHEKHKRTGGRGRSGLVRSMVVVLMVVVVAKERQQRKAFSPRAAQHEVVGQPSHTGAKAALEQRRRGSDDARLLPRCGRVRVGRPVGCGACLRTLRR